MAKPIEDLTNRRFGRWVVLKLARIQKYPNASIAIWLCRCDCGTEREVRGQSLRNGTSVSCRCYQREFQHARKTVHGQTVHRGPATSEYTAWAHMKQRCANPNNVEYKNYGARGIVVCSRWNSFAIFFQDMGPKPTPNHTLERKDNDKGYSPDNCKWATQSEQSRNHRRNHWIEWNGERKLITEWSRELGGKPCGLSMRLKRGWSIERAMTTPF